MIERLQECQSRNHLSHSSLEADMSDAASIGPNLSLYLPEPASTPARALEDLALSDPASPTRYSPLPNLVNVMPETEGISRKRGSVLLKAKRESESWEVLSTSGASLISPMKDQPHGGSVSSWKSAGNGERLDEFGAIGMSHTFLCPIPQCL